jgi:ketosteroid isomerase-like protein
VNKEVREMKRLLVLFVGLALLLAGCGGGGLEANANSLSGRVANADALSGPAAETEALFKDWADAAASLDLERLVSHYADEVAFNTEEGEPPVSRDKVKEAYQSVMELRGAKLVTEQYFVSGDGQWVAMEGTLSWSPVGRSQAAYQGIILLKFRNGEIVREIQVLSPIVVSGK